MEVTYRKLFRAPLWVAACLVVAATISCASRDTSQDDAALRTLAEHRAGRAVSPGCVDRAPHGQYRAEIEPYLAFLRALPARSPVDYVLGLFETHDIVILCER